MTIDARRIQARPLPALEERRHPALDGYLERAGAIADEGDGQTHWRCPDLCGASCACTGPARRLAHRPCSRPIRPTDWLGREEPRR